MNAATQHSTLKTEHLLQFGHLDRVLTRLADAAEQRSRGDDRLVGAAPVVVERYDMRHLADVLLADRAAAEDTGPVRGALAVPAVHRLSLPSRSGCLALF